jgi:hypothetical protein
LALPSGSDCFVERMIYIMLYTDSGVKDDDRFQLLRKASATKLGDQYEAATSVSARKF